MKPVVMDTSAMRAPEEILIAMISEVRNALVPARFHLRREQGAPARTALAAIQRALDFTTSCAERLNKHETEQPQEILVTLINEIRDALMPTRLDLEHASGAHARTALAAIQRALDFTATCAEKLDKSTPA